MADSKEGRIALSLRREEPSSLWANSRAGRAVIQKGMERAHTGPVAFNSKTFTAIDAQDFAHTEDRSFSSAEIALAKVSESCAQGTVDDENSIYIACIHKSEESSSRSSIIDLSWSAYEAS